MSATGYNHDLLPNYVPNEHIDWTSTDKDLTTTGNISSEKNGILSYLTEETNTTITTAGTFQHIEGTFGYPILENFEAVTIEEEPKIKYIGSKKMYFKIDWATCVSVSDNSTTVIFGVNNGEVQCCSRMQVYAKSNDESYNVSGIAVVELDVNDTIQLVVTSDGNGDVISIKSFIFSIKEFF